MKYCFTNKYNAVITLESGVLTMSEDSLKDSKRDMEDLVIALMRINAVLARSKYKNQEDGMRVMKKIIRDLETLLSDRQREVRELKKLPTQTPSKDKKSLKDKK